MSALEEIGTDEAINKIREALENNKDRSYLNNLRSDRLNKFNLSP
jgi:hypothetical protein